MRRIRIGGVPEHFNLPIHLAVENGWFSDLNIELQWTDFPGGSGDMKEALRNNDVDMCILLTEGIVTDAIKGNPSKIVSGFVKTSLTWGIHTSLKYEDDHLPVFEKKIAISRYGSGSHLMPIVNAMMQEQTIHKDQFVEVKDINGGIESLNSNETEVFYWEKFTTKPYLEKGKLKKIGEFISPWPCFMIAATNDIIESDPTLVSQVLKVIHKANQSFMELDDAPKLVAKRFNLDIKDAERWYHATEWFTNGWVSNKMLEGVHYSLKEAKIVDLDSSIEGIIWKRNERK
ncbi:ABC transporter substrate-binding protein [Ekhidna sp. To15]|uniref:ABC transporter substrate-binding protein n=1 Tax=Ekhidna sp. To15 TaxID=3395267 RepID=UPI003F51D235